MRMPGQTNAEYLLLQPMGPAQRPNMISWIAARNAVAIYRRNELGQMQLRAVNEIAGVLDTAALTEMLRTIAGGADPQSVAEQWLAANPLGR
jgi:hypothetical protein